MSAITQTPETSHGGKEKDLTLLEHLQELRYRMMVCAGALVVAMIVSFWQTETVLRWLQEPAKEQVNGFELVFTQPLEYWTTYFRVSLMIGVVIAMPVFLWQFLAFVGPGLTRNEKKWAYPIVAGATAMFIAGCLFAYYIELPPAMNFLLNTDEARALISVQKYVDFVTKMMLVNGLAFQTPLIVMGLAKIGLVTAKRLWGWWRFAIVGAFIISAVVTPSIDPVTQTLVAGPMIVLYFVGIGLAKMVERTPIIPRQ